MKILRETEYQELLALKADHGDLLASLKTVRRQRDEALAKAERMFISAEDERKRLAACRENAAQRDKQYNSECKILNATIEERELVIGNLQKKVEQLLNDLDAWKMEYGEEQRPTSLRVRLAAAEKSELDFQNKWKAAIANKERVQKQLDEAKEQLAQIDAVTVWFEERLPENWEQLMPLLQGVSVNHPLLVLIRTLLEAECDACMNLASDPAIPEREERHAAGGAYHIDSVLKNLAVAFVRSKRMTEKEAAEKTGEKRLPNKLTGRASGGRSLSR